MLHSMPPRPKRVKRRPQDFTNTLYLVAARESIPQNLATLRSLLSLSQLQPRQLGRFPQNAEAAPDASLRRKMPRPPQFSLKAIRVVLRAKPISFAVRQDRDDNPRRSRRSQRPCRLVGRRARGEHVVDQEHSLATQIEPAPGLERIVDIDAALRGSLLGLRHRS